MTAEARRQDVVTGALLCAGVALVVIAITATTVRVAGLADDARHALGFRFIGVPHKPGIALSIGLRNARLVGGTLLCALAVQHLPKRARPIVDLSLAFLAALNVGALGVAFGAYGSRLVLAVGLHLPLELAALSLAGRAYMSARRRPLCVTALAEIGATCLLLLAAAGTLETYVAEVRR